MSRQRIDLYRDDLRPREPSRELARNLALIGVAVFAMLVWGGIAQWQASTTTRDLAALTAEQEGLQAQMAAATEQLAARVPDAALSAALIEAQFAVDGRRWLLDELARAGDEAVPFSGVLEGLGRQRPAPLWLTRIHVADAGAHLGLGGRTLDADAVPGFLERLGAEPALKDRDFSHFRIDRPEDAGEPLRFDMATDCVALASGCAPGTTPEATP
jgi:Tfp pilus assembly protein PilN